MRATTAEVTAAEDTTTNPHTARYWREGASALQPRCQAFIDGRFTAAGDAATFPCVNPATNTVLAEVTACGEAEVNQAVRGARTVFQSGLWSRQTPGQRKKVLLRLVELIEQYAEELALLDCLNMGKPIADAYERDLPFAAGVLRWFAEATDKIYGQIAPTGPTDLALVTAEPVGVVAAVTSWNFPLVQAIWKLAPALAAGNSVILKPAEQAPLSSLLLAELAVRAGLPDSVLQVVPGLGPTTGAILGRHSDVDCLTFTGSTVVGKRFLGYAAESSLKRVWLECGGKSPNLVFASTADLDTAARAACQGIFFNQGEVCSANSRLLVENSIAEEFIDRVVSQARCVQPGDPLEPATRMGPLANRTHTERVMRYIAEGIRAATLLSGGNRITIDDSDCFVEPTVFTDVPPDSPVAREEIFGPVLTIDTFDSEQHALDLANDTPYGLAASVWTNDLPQAHRVAAALRVGTVSINTVDAISPMTPFGGTRESGNGRDLSLHSITQYTNLKTTWLSLS